MFVFAHDMSIASCYITKPANRTVFIRQDESFHKKGNELFVISVSTWKIYFELLFSLWVLWIIFFYMYFFILRQENNIYKQQKNFFIDTILMVVFF